MTPPWAESPWRCLSQMKQPSTPLPRRPVEAQLASGRRGSAGSGRCAPYTPNRHAVEAAAGLDGGATGGRDLVLLRLLALVRVLEEAVDPHARDAAGFLRRGGRPGRRAPPLDVRPPPPSFGPDTGAGVCDRRGCLAL